MLFSSKEDIDTTFRLNSSMSKISSVFNSFELSITIFIPKYSKYFNKSSFSKYSFICKEFNSKNIFMFLFIFTSNSQAFFATKQASIKSVKLEFDDIVAIKISLSFTTLPFLKESSFKGTSFTSILSNPFL